MPGSGMYVVVIGNTLSRRRTAGAAYNGAVLITEFVWPEDRVDHIGRHGIRFRDGKGCPVPARDMTDTEKRRYRDWKQR